jgi:GTP-binding protein
MSPHEIAARRSALERASGQEVLLMSGVTGQGVPDMLRRLMAATHRVREPA